MNTLDALLAGIVAEPREETRWLVLADWLEEFDDPRRGELLRLHRNMIATCLEPDEHPVRAVWQSRMVELLAAGVAPCVPQHAMTLPGGVELLAAFIPPGTFRMGGSIDDYDERPVFTIAVPDGFFMGTCPVTQAQWAAVMGTDPSQFKGPNRPVECLTWYDCQEFCRKLTESLGGAGIARLPTEPEWEYACRAGTTTPFHFGNILTTDQANYNGTLPNQSRKHPTPPGQNRKQTTDVMSFPANPWGLYDLHGNVEEWCLELYKPPGEPRDDFHRVLRGGDWHTWSEHCRAAFHLWRVPAGPAGPGATQGFRVCFRLN